VARSGASSGSRWHLARSVSPPPQAAGPRGSLIGPVVTWWPLVSDVITACKPRSAPVQCLLGPLSSGRCGRTRRREAAPRRGLEFAVRRISDLESAVRRTSCCHAPQQRLDELAAPTGLQLSLPKHGFCASRTSLRVEQSPRARPTFGMKRSTVLGIVVLSQSALQITALANVCLTLRVDQNIHVMGH
jgi:hypothetical protein